MKKSDFKSYLLLSLNLLCLVLGKGEINFGVIGDWGGLPTPPYKTAIETSISRQLIELTNQHKIEFLLALGDNFYYDGVKNISDLRFVSSFESVFQDKDLFFPWFFVAGNHDWRGNVSAQIEYSKYSKRWNFPDYFYRLNKTFTDSSTGRQVNVGILMIDTVILCGNIDSDFTIMMNENHRYRNVVKQSTIDKYWQYIFDSLTQFNSYDYIIVAGHYPVWSIAEHGPTKCLVEQLDPLLKKFNVSAYINGHDHTMEHIQVIDNGTTMNYMTVGAANFVSNKFIHKHSIPKDSLRYYWINNKTLGALAQIHIDAQSMKVTYISTDHSILYQTNIKPRWINK